MKVAHGLGYTRVTISTVHSPTHSAQRCTLSTGASRIAGKWVVT